MRRFSAGHVLSWAAVAVLTLVSPCAAPADLIVPGPSASDEAPVPSPATEAPGRVGYTLTADEFIGGVIMSVLAIGGAIYVGIKAGKNEL